MTSYFLAFGQVFNFSYGRQLSITYWNPNANLPFLHLLQLDLILHSFDNSPSRLF
jgi:hypothetical protein